jgi:hypothetical protein
MGAGRVPIKVGEWLCERSESITLLPVYARRAGSCATRRLTRNEAAKIERLPAETIRRMLT